MTPEEILDANLRALLTRAYAPVEPRPAFRARLARELAAGALAPELRRRLPARRLALAAGLLLAIGLALYFFSVRGPGQLTESAILASGHSALSQDSGPWRALSEEEGLRGIEYRSGELRLALASARASERVWIGAHGSLRAQSAARVALSGGASTPRVDLDGGRARIERQDSGAPWRIRASGLDLELESGALALENRGDELAVRLESGAGSYGPDRRPLPARRELFFRGGLLVETPVLENPDPGGERAAFAAPEEPAPAPGAPGLRFAGRVLGPDGEPWTAAFQIFLLREERLPVVARAIGRTFQSAQGAFEFPVARGGRYTVFALAAGCATQRRAGLEPALQPAALELRLERGLELHGRVVDAATGLPLAGATVVSEDDAPLQILPFDPAELPAELRARARSDAAGNFVLEHVSSGLHTLRASAPGLSAVWSPRIDARSAPAELVLALGPGGAVEVQIEPPRAGERVVASALDYSFLRPCLSYALVRTDAQGRARFEHLPVGPFVVLRAEGQQTTDVSYTFVREAETSEVQLGLQAHDRAFGGRVLDATGAPLADLDLMLQAIAPQDEHWHSTRTDAAGHFRFEGVHPGEFGLYAGDLGRNFVEIDRLRMGTLDVERDVELPGGSIRGRVREAASGRALADAWLVVQRERGGAWEFAGKVQADAQGSWQVRNLAAGTWRIVAYAHSERLAPAASAPLELRTGEPPAEAELALEPGAALDLCVRDAHGATLPGVNVELRDADGDRWQFSPADRTDAAGHFAVAGMPPGAWTVRVTRPGSADAEKSFQLEVDQTSSFEIVLQPH